MAAPLACRPFIVCDEARQNWGMGADAVRAFPFKIDGLKGVAPMIGKPPPWIEGTGINPLPRILQHVF